jgi:hypothetical protein
MVAWIACNLLGWLAAPGPVLVLRTPEILKLRGFENDHS